MKSSLHSRFCRAAVLLALPVIVLASGMPLRAGGAEHVIHISADGLNAILLQKLIDDGEAPNFKRLRDEGAWTFNARTDYTHTITLPNHTSIFTGRPVLQPNGMPDVAYHGWTTNSVPKVGGILHDPKNSQIGYVASVFDVVHDAGLSTALYATKDKFSLYDASYDANHGATNEHGRDKIDTYFCANDGPPRFSQSVQERFLADLRQRHFNYVFVHYRDPDTVGHALGWGSAAWMYALRNIDGYLGEVLRLVETDPVLARRTAVIVCTDHGGKGFGHSDPAVPENYTVPLLVWGAGVGRGELYLINDQSRSDPHSGRPDYEAKGQPIRNGETGNLAIKLLGLPAIARSILNSKQDLRVALPGDYNLDGVVDNGDYLNWRQAEGSTTKLYADGNGDGVVNKADYEIWKANFGRSAMPK